MTTYAINRSDVTLPVEIEFPETPDQPREFVFIQAKSKAMLPAGSKVTAGFKALNAKDLVLTKIDEVGEPVSA